MAGADYSGAGLSWCVSLALLSRPRPVVGPRASHDPRRQISAQGQRLKNVPPFFLPVRVLPPSTSLNSQISLT